MRIVQINATCGIGSTGKICVGISELLNAQDIENYILCSKTDGYAQGIAVSSDRYVKMQALRSRLLGNYGFNSIAATKRLIHELDRLQPDLVHLHNIHGHDCNLDMLFTYFKETKTKLVWTFHDCWAFTGYCTYFDMAACDKWQTTCADCPQVRRFSWLFDKSTALYQKKKKLFAGLDLTIVTPSDWLASLVKQSFLKDYPVKVIHNGIDLNVFKPCASDFRQVHGIADQHLLLGVAFGWEKRKGLDVFEELANRLPEEYRIVLVGTDEAVDKRLNDRILSIHRTQNQQELAQLYATADLLVNPTMEENYPTVNMEAVACGTPVLTFDTGGSREMLDDTCGAAVKRGDVDAMEKEIVRICTAKPFTEQACVRKSREYDQTQRFAEYVTLYQRLI